MIRSQIVELIHPPLYSWLCYYLFSVKPTVSIDSGPRAKHKKCHGTTLWEMGVARQLLESAFFHHHVKITSNTLPLQFTKPGPAVELKAFVIRFQLGGIPRRIWIHKVFMHTMTQKRKIRPTQKRNQYKSQPLRSKIVRNFFSFHQIVLH